MNEFGLKAKDATVADLGLKHFSDAYWNLSPAELVEETIIRGEGMLTDTGALAVDTGKFTGRSPKDKFIVCDEKTEKAVWWETSTLNSILKIRSLVWKSYFLFSGKNFVCTRCLCMCWSKIQIKYSCCHGISMAESGLQTIYFFVLLTKNFKMTKSDWTILCAPGFHADQNWMVLVRAILPSLISPRRLFSLAVPVIPEKSKKGIFQFWILFYRTKKMFSPCIAPLISDRQGDTAIFFGLSGTGKQLFLQIRIVDLSEMMNMVGRKIQCLILKVDVTQKCVNLTKEKEPQIFSAIRFGALVWEHWILWRNNEGWLRQYQQNWEYTCCLSDWSHWNAVEPSVAEYQKYFLPHLWCIRCIASNFKAGCWDKLCIILFQDTLRRLQGRKLESLNLQLLFSMFR